MLEGLETVVVDYSTTFGNKDFRVDSDFWTKEPKKNPNLKYDKIGNVLVSAQYGISVSMNEDGIGYPIYRMNEIHNMMCDLEVDKHADISKEEFGKFRLNDRDVLFNRTNSYEWVGRTGIYRKLDNQEFTFASYLVRFIPDENYIFPEYLATYLNTKYGIWDVKRRSRQSINQTNVNPEEVKEIYIPLLNKSLQNFIKYNFEIAHTNRIKSSEVYNQAETLLLETLGLNDFEINSDAVNIKGFKESFLSTGRLDAEYYQKKYDILEKKIKSTTFKRIEEIRTDNYRGMQPVYIEDGEIDVINSKHILESSLDYERFEKTSSEYWDKQKRARVSKGDILTYTTGANIGRTQVYLSDKKALASNHVNILRLNGENPYYIGFVLNSVVGRLQTEKFSAGSAQAELYPKDIDEFIVPIIEKSLQEKIIDLFNDSFHLKKESEQLLDLAKRAVEVAIEEGEEKAMEMIEIFF